VVYAAASVPAQAASPLPCASVPTNSMNLSTQQGADGTGVSWASTFVDNTAGTNNLSTSDGNVGWLKLSNRARDATPTNPATRYQDVTLTFTQPVSFLAFTIRDLDTYDGAAGGTPFWDRIALVGVSASSVNDAGIAGTGTLSDPWRQSQFTGIPASDTASTNETVVTIIGPITSFTLRLWTSEGAATGTPTQPHSVWVGNMTYKANCVP
jgi:hypothetical protein